MQIMQATGSCGEETKRGSYSAIAVEERRTLNVLAARVRVFALARVEIEEEQALQITAPRIHRIALHLAEPLVLVLDSIHISDHLLPSILLFERQSEDFLVNAQHFRDDVFRREILLHQVIIHMIQLLLQLLYIIAEVPRLQRTLFSTLVLESSQLFQLFSPARLQFRAEIEQKLLYVLGRLRHLVLQRVGRIVRIAQNVHRLLSQLDRFGQEIDVLLPAAVVECGHDLTTRVSDRAVLQHAEHIGVLHGDDVGVLLSAERRKRVVRNAHELLLREKKLRLLLGKIHAERGLVLYDLLHHLLVLLTLLGGEMGTTTSGNEKGRTPLLHASQVVLDVLLNIGVVLFIALLSIL